MPFNINTFKQAGLIFGGARPSLFEVQLTVPGAIGINSVSLQKFTFLCKAAELPESTISSIEVPYFGRKIKVAGERTFSDWTVTVMNDEDFAVRSMFEAWSNAINRHVANVRDIALAAEQYKTLADVIQYSKDGEVIRAYQLVGTFPTTISGISLGWDSQNAVEEFSVTFAYDYWVPLVEESTKSGATNVYGGVVDVGSV